jgi:hypothetical protein
MAAQGSVLRGERELQYNHASIVPDVDYAAEDEELKLRNRRILIFNINVLSHNLNKPAVIFYSICLKLYGLKYLPV